MPDYIPVSLRKQIEQSDRGRCCYRVTITTLRMNHSVIVVARRRWASEGWHPPTD